MQQKGKVEAWDTLRFVMIFGIVLYHAQTFFNEFGMKFLAPVYTLGGYFGNYFFFILSGLLIARTYHERIENASVSLGGFLWGRVRKFYPLFLVSEVIAIVCEVVQNGWAGITLKRLITDSLFITAGWIDQYTSMYNLPTWFLCVLMLCYILYYLIARATKGRRYLYLIICGFLVIYGRYLEMTALRKPFMYRFTGEGYMNFFLGCLLYEGMQLIAASSRRKWFTLGAWGVAAVAAAGTALLGVNAFWSDTVGCVSFLCVLLIFLSAETGWLRRILECRITKPLQEVSLEMFLLHFPLLSAYSLLTPHTPLAALGDGVRYALYLVILLVIVFAVNAIRKRRA